MVVRRIAYWAQVQPEKVAVIDRDETISYANFGRSIHRHMAHFSAHGIPDHGVAAIVSRAPFADWLIVLSLRALGLDTICLKSLDQADSLHLKNLACVIIPESLANAPALEGTAFTGAMIVLRPDFSGIDHQQTPPLPVDGDSRLGGHIVYTSGTTGTYKKALMAGHFEDRRNVTRSEALSFNRDTIFHNLDFGLWTGGGFKQPSAAWHVGATVIFDGRQEKIANILRYPVTAVSLLPPQVRELLDARQGLVEQDAGLLDFTLYVSSGFLPVATAERVVRELTSKLLLLYSATELIDIPMHTLFESSEDCFWFSVTDTSRVVIRNDLGAESGPDEDGQLGIRLGEIDCATYLDDDNASAKAFADGYFLPGDRAVRRRDGKVRILGRIADVLNVGGQKITAAPIEQSIQQNLGVDDVCIFSGLGDSGREEIVIAIQAATQKPKDQIGRALANHASLLAAFNEIRVVFFPEFPRTEFGTRKVNRSELRRLVFRNGVRE